MTNGSRVMSLWLERTPGALLCCCYSLQSTLTVVKNNVPQLVDIPPVWTLSRSLYRRAYASWTHTTGLSSDEVDSIDDLPFISGTISVFNSAVATFYAPSDESSIHSMRWERIRSTRSWRKGPARCDCAFSGYDNRGRQPYSREKDVIAVADAQFLIDNVVENKYGRT